MVTNNATIARPASLEEVHRQVEAMLADGQAPQAVAVLFTLIQSMQQEIGGLSQRVSSLLKQVYGSRSEKVDPNQLQLFLTAISQDPAAQRVAAELPPVPQKPVSQLPKPAPKPAPHGRRPLPADLARETVELKPASGEQYCGRCDCDKVLIGYETSELLDWKPGHFVVTVLRRAKMACPKCGEGVVVAPVADKVIEKGRPGVGLLAHLLVSKYQDALPLNRQAGIFKRHGVDLSTSTLSDWVGAGADAFKAIHAEMVRQAMDAYLLGTDDTGLKVLDREHENGIRRGYMWAYVADDRLVVFDYTPDRKADGPASFLVKHKGYVQCDGYSGYKRIARDRPDVVWVGCMAHLRRKFVEALDGGDLRAAAPVAILQALYRVESEATEASDPPDKRLDRRRQVGVPAMASLQKWLRDMQMQVPPKTPLGRAITYAINQWASLQVYLTDGRIPIDNNAVERQIRRIAVGRKNYLFAGSDAGAERAATLYSVLGTCSLVGVDPYAYMRDVLERVSAGWPGSRVAELLPAAWAAEQARPADPAPHA